MDRNVSDERAAYFLLLDSILQEGDPWSLEDIALVFNEPVEILESVLNEFVASGDLRRGTVYDTGGDGEQVVYFLPESRSRPRRAALAN